MNQKQTNWAGNHTYSAARLHYPETIEQVQTLVAGSSKLKTLGSRHSFNDIADSPEDLISLERFDPMIELDRERGMVTVAGGVKYGQLAHHLHGEGYALHNMASLPHISVAGACATATHGSGDKNGNLATAVAALEIVTANGDLVTLSREKDGEQFNGAVVSMGGLGVVTRVTLDMSPTFTIRQDLYENLPVAQLADHFEEIVASAYSVSLFTDWQSSHVNQVWLKRRIEAGSSAALEPTWFEATLAGRKLHPLTIMSAENCTEQMGIDGPWYERLPHFRMDHTPSSGDELQTEYFVPRQSAYAAFQAINGLREHLGPQLMISEVRTIAGDNLWMSPAYKQSCVGFHFTWQNNWQAVSNILPLIEAELAPFNARPHWGKLFATPPAQLQLLYQKLPDFRQLLQHYDPQGKFRNRFLDTYIFGNS